MNINLTISKILKTSPTALTMPRAWVDMYVPWIVRSSLQGPPQNWEETTIYQQSLVKIITRFCDILSKWDAAFEFDTANFMYGSRSYPYSLLQRRNVELLLVAITNLGTRAVLPAGFLSACDAVRKVRCLPHPMNISQTLTPQRFSYLVPFVSSS